MDMNKYNKGLEILESIAPGAGARVKNNLETIAPDMVKYLMEFVFGEISSRPGLDMKIREIVAVSALTGTILTVFRWKSLQSRILQGIEKFSNEDIFFQCGL